MQEQQPIGIFLISTGKYKQFVRPLIDSLDKHFLKSRKLIIYLFTDEEFYVQGYNRISVKQKVIPSYQFPYATLYRYHIILSRTVDNCSHFFYMDVDMKVVADVGEEILGEIVAVRHPGFDKVGGGSWETRPQSACFTSTRESYYAGGFQGGSAYCYSEAVKKMKAMIQADEENGIMPVWHDESTWNFFLSTTTFPVTELDSSYCMVEQMELRRKWKIDHLQPKIIALEKNHQKIRE